MSDDIDRMGDLFEDEEPEEPDDEPDDIHSSLSIFLDPDYGYDEYGNPEEEEFSIQIDPRVADKLDELYGFDQFNPQDMFIRYDDIVDWSEVRGQHFSTQFGALEYILEGGMQGFAQIFYNEETDDWQVYVSYLDSA